MKNKKKIIALALATATVLSLASCGPKSSNGGTASITVGADGLKNFGDVKLTMLQCWNGGMKLPTDQYGNDVAKAIRDKIGVTVTYTPDMQTETDKLNLMFASGDMPDIVNAPFWGGTDAATVIIKKAATQGRLLAFDDAIKNYPDLQKSYALGDVSEAFLKNDIEDPSFKGKHYVLPTGGAQSVDDITNWGYGVFCRQDILKALKVDPATVDTSQKLFTFLQQVKAGNFKDVNGNAVIPLTTFHQGWSIMRTYVSFENQNFTDGTGLRLGTDGKMVFDSQTPDYYNEMLFVRNMVAGGLVDKECFACTDDQAKTKVGNGTAACATLQYQPIIDATKASGLYDAHPEMRYMPLGPFKYKDGTPVVQAQTDGSTGSGVIFFTSSNKNLDASLAYMSYVNSKDGKTILDYGFKDGTNPTYVENSSNQPRMTDALTASYQKDQNTTQTELINRGINAYSGAVNIFNNSVTYYGEASPFSESGTPAELTAYRKVSPVKIVKGYLIDSNACNFPQIADFQAATASVDISTAQKQAWFAPTDAAAKSILDNYNKQLFAANSGVAQKYLDYFTGIQSTRTDWLY